MTVSTPAIVKPNHRFLFKPVDNCETTEGCHMDVWLPDGAKEVTSEGGRMLTAEGEWYSVTQFDIRDDLMDAYHFIQQKLNSQIAEELDIKHEVVNTQSIILFGGSAGGTSVLCLAADIEKYNNNSENTEKLPQVKAILCAYPLTDPNNHFAEPKAVWAEKTSKMFPEDWELIKDFPTTGKVCTSYNFPIGRWDTCKDPRFLFARTAMATQTLNSFLYGCDAPYPASVTALDLISQTFPPTYVLAAMADDLIPVEHSFLLYDKLQKQGVESHIAKVGGAGHGFVERPPTDWPADTDYWKSDIREAVEWAVAKVKSARLLAGEYGHKSRIYLAPL
ncbi:hypothetical protein QFC22_005152 [Naganishia vaughanmartiniae]|uniref:Uncharacterized protein n=1 Tax=Naganishia vaughanmartiniae TaxID=1424756 RepID=A0ACC2WY39_9TREE|nr:hypothetical protein QFC22_005152 [Naganishia vaughanmartiniae]